MNELSAALIAQILATTPIYSDAVRRLGVLKSFLINKVFGSKFQTSDIYPEDLSWLKSLTSQFLDQFNNNNLYSAFEGVEKTINQTNFLTVYLPLELPDSETKNLASYLRTNFGEHFLFEVKYDPLLVGGCSLVWKGVYKDYSLKQKIADNHYPILKLLKEYV